MKPKNEIKMLAAQKGVTLTYIATYLSEKLNKKYPLDTLSKKLRNDTLKYSEAKLIAEALGMELKFIDKE